MQEQEDRISSITDEDDAAGWIVTYADLVTLLLVFFVLLFSISSLHVEKFKNVMKSIQLNLGETDPSINLLKLLNPAQKPEMELSIEQFTNIRSRDKELIDDIEEILNEETIGDNIVLQTSEGRIGIVIKGKVLFEAGEADMNYEAMPIMYKIATIIADYPEYSVNIKGYTDNAPISTEKFPSNWELSAIRATTVLKYLVNEGISPKRLTATGYGDLLPIAANDTEENRAKNRRVEFVLEKKKN